MGCRGGSLALLLVAGSATSGRAEPAIEAHSAATRAGPVDVAITSTQQLIGFNMVPELEQRVIVGKRLAGARVEAQLAYGQSLTSDDCYGDAQLTALHPVARHVVAGLGSRLRLDLQDDPVEPAGERAWDAAAGPIASVAVGRVAVGAMAGVSALRDHAAASARVGAIAELGLASTF